MNSVKDLNKFVFSSPSMQAIYIPKTVDLLKTLFKETSHQPKEIFSIDETWASITLRDQGLSVDVGIPIKDKKYDTILGFDEAFCKSKSENQQRQFITDTMQLLDKNGVLFTSIRDYKNGNFHKRILGDTMLNNIDGEEYITVEIIEHNEKDKQSWVQKMMLIQNQHELNIMQPITYRTLYFKQFARYCKDQGFLTFGMFKDSFWKNNWHRTLEHIAWVKNV